MSTRLIRASSAALSNARCSTWVTSDSTLMIARRLKCDKPLRAERTKWSNIVRVRSKSATTPSTSGAITVTSRASRPCILCASLPTAITSPVTLLTATTDGSSTTTPRPRTAMIVLAEPMSIAIESETRFLRALRPRKVLVLPMNDIKNIANCRFQLVTAVRRLRSGVADQNLAAARVRFESGRRVDGITDGRVFRTPLRTDITDNHFAGVQAHADTDFRKSFLAKLAIDAQHSPLHRHRGV